MKEILLIMLLAIAIACDIIRIVQYRAISRKASANAIHNYAYKYRRLWRKFFGTTGEVGQKDLNDYADYCVEHWNEE